MVYNSTLRLFGFTTKRTKDTKKSHFAFPYALFVWKVGYANNVTMDAEAEICHFGYEKHEKAWKKAETIFVPFVIFVVNSPLSK